jgi:hypothetical protein
LHNDSRRMPGTYSVCHKGARHDMVDRIRRATMVAGVLMGLGMATVANADSLTLAWDRSPDTTVTGYKVVVGTAPGVYFTTLDVGNVLSATFSNAQPNVRYYFAIASYSGSVVGPLSAEVSGISNASPTLLNPGNQTTIVGTPVSLLLSGSDPLGEPVSYRASGLPTGLTLTLSTGLITGIPTTVGNYAVTATATDGILSGSQSFTWTVTSTAPAPSTGVVLTGRGYKDKGSQRAALQWTGASWATVAVFRNTTRVASVSNTTSYTDSPGTKGGGSYTYKVCDAANAAACSNTVTVQF